MNATTRLHLEPLNERTLPAAFPITLAAGGVVWAVDNAGGTDAKGVADNSPGLRIADATLEDSGRTDAFDGAGVLLIDGKPLVASADATVTGTTLTTGPVSLSGLNVAVQYSARSGSPTLRTLVTLQNPGTTAITVPVSWLNNLGSDADTVVAGTSSGDDVFTAGNRWVVTDDAEATGGKPAVLHVLAGPGALPAAVSRTVFDNAGTEGIRADYTVTIPAGAARSLLFFQQIRDDRSTQTNAALAFNGNPAGGDELLEGLGAAQRSTIVNWDFTLPPTTGGGTPPPPVAPSAPTLTGLAISTSNEGEAATLRGTIADVDSAGPFTVTVTWGDGSDDTFRVPKGAFNFSHVYGTDKVGNYPVAVTVADAGGLTATGNVSAVVNNSLPAIVGLTATAAPGSPVALTGTVVDPGTADGIAVTVTWGDGASERLTLPTAGPFRFTHAYTGTKVGGFTIQVSADDGAGSVSATATATILNRTPTIANLKTAVDANRTATLTAVVGDAETDGQLTLTVEWGDGTSDVIALPVGATDVTEMHTYATPGNYRIRATVTDADKAAAEATTSAVVGTTTIARATKFLAVGSGVGAAPSVMLLDAATRAVLRTLTPFESDFTGGVTVATADLNGDGIDDVIAGAGLGGGPRVVAFDGATGAMLADFFAYATDLRSGVNVAAGDLDGDGKAEIVTGAGVGGSPHVRVFGGAAMTLRTEYMSGKETARGGATVAVIGSAAGGPARIVVGSGVGEAPAVQLLDPTDGRFLAGFSPFEAEFLGGVHVAAADLDRDGIADVIAGAGAGGGPRVMVFSGRGLQNKAEAEIANFFAGDSSDRSGVRVGRTDVDGDGLADLVTAPSASARVAAYAGPAVMGRAAPVEVFTLDLAATLHGVFVG